MVALAERPEVSDDSISVSVVPVPADEELTEFYNKRLEEFEAVMLQQPDCRPLPAKHHFAKGVYFREGNIPAGHWGLGHAHKQEELTVIFSGMALVAINGKVGIIQGPCVVKTAAGVRKLILALTDLPGGNIFYNPTNERDIDKLETLMIEKSPTRLAFEAKRRNEITA